MSSRRIKIAAVSYLNTLPFVYGMQASESNFRGELLLAVPRVCAELYKSKDVDIALVPLATVLEMDDAEIITDYCISADEIVRTVALFSAGDISQIKNIYLDEHSRTSRELVKILCREYWHISPRFFSLSDYSLMDTTSVEDAYLLIGDKVFEHECKFAKSYDLCREWVAMTGEPFVFAVWIARRGVSPSYIESLSEALRYGVNNIDNAIASSVYSNTPYAKEYLTQNIKFNLTDDKRRGMKLFLQHVSGRKSEPSSYL